MGTGSKRPPGRTPDEDADTAPALIAALAYLGARGALYSGTSAVPPVPSCSPRCSAAGPGPSSATDTDEEEMRAAA